MFVERLVSHSRCEQEMMSFMRQASWAKMTSPVGKLTAIACHPTKNVNKTGELAYPSTNFGHNLHI